MMNDIGIALAVAHTEELIHEAEAQHLAALAKPTHTSLQNRLLVNLGDMLISSGEWIKSRNAPDIPQLRQN